VPLPQGGKISSRQIGGGAGLEDKGKGFFTHPPPD